MAWLYAGDLELDLVGLACAHRSDSEYHDEAASCMVTLAEGA